MPSLLGQFFRHLRSQGARVVRLADQVAMSPTYEQRCESCHILTVSDRRLLSLLLFGMQQMVVQYHRFSATFLELALGHGLQEHPFTSIHCGHS